LWGMRIRAPTELLNVMRDLGADFVNMLMGEVYSALAKGIIDGLIAPTDTFKSLHLSEVAHYYTELIIPRGAYPARAMGRARWESLSAQQRAVLEESIAVWEAALAEENRRALEEGWLFAVQEGVEKAVASAADQQRFDTLYLKEAERNAKLLARYDIDGDAVFELARASIGEDGNVSCAEHTG